jgi:hypothetical protein
MKLKEELKRMRTAAFWNDVRYWSAIKWTGKLRQPIACEDWLPMLTSLVVGIILFVVIVFILAYIKEFMHGTLLVSAMLS